MVRFLFLTRSAFILRSSRLADRKGQAIASSFLIGPNFKRRDSRGVRGNSMVRTSNEKQMKSSEMKTWSLYSEFELLVMGISWRRTLVPSIQSTQRAVAFSRGVVTHCCFLFEEAHHETARKSGNYPISITLY